MSDAQNHRFLVLCACILSLLVAVDVVSVLRITNNHDFAVYYEAAQRLRAGQDIYAELAPFRAHVESALSTAREDTPWPFSTPPFHALLTLPLTLLPYAWAAGAWTALCLAAIAVSLLLILRSQAWLTVSRLVLVLLLVYQFQPAVVALRLGQIDILIWLLIILAFVWLRDGRDSWAGLALGLAIGVKVFAVFLVLFLLWKRRWRAAIWAGISGAIFLLGSFALVGADAFKRYLDFSSLYTRGAFAGYPYHQSLNSFFTRTFKPNMFLAPVADLPWLADGLTIVLSAALILGLLWLTRRAGTFAGSNVDLQYALALTTMLLVLPPAPRYAFIWLLLGFIIVAARLVRGSGPIWMAGLLALSYVLSARLLYFPVPLLRRLVMDGQFMLVALLLWLAMAWLLWRAGPQEGVS